MVSAPVQSSLADEITWFHACGLCQAPTMSRSMSSCGNAGTVESTVAKTRTTGRSPIVLSTFQVLTEARWKKMV
ncbi:hypothetical protein C8R44DRAFT_799249 [Mycena epipterygia]|nr:hypothetical protein C8R44DRAFT_799249 [Mycena epipterygia]